MSNSVVVSRLSEKQRSLEALVAHRLKIKSESKYQNSSNTYLKNRISIESKINYILSK